jgi:hypothetical protein
MEVTHRDVVGDGVAEDDVGGRGRRDAPAPPAEDEDGRGCYGADMDVEDSARPGL